MIKKSQLLIAILLIFLLTPFLIQAIDPVATTEKYSGDLDPETGLPKQLEPITDVGEKVVEGDVTTEYLKQEWLKIFEKSEFGKKFSPVFSFIGKIFSFFNPIWKIALGIEFSWTWTFFLGFLIWIALVIIFYSPSKAFLEFNPLFILIFSMIVATLAGSGGVIKFATNILSTMLSNIWLVGVSIFIGVLIMIFYYKFFGDFEKDMKEKSDKEKRQRAQKSIETAGEVAEEFLDS